MAYKKYIKRGGKVYGPYIYHSRREGGKVISEYHGPKKIDYKKPVFLSVGMVVLIVVVYMLAFSSPRITGGAILNLDANFQEGEPLQGKLLLSLQEGEFIPASSKLVFENNGDVFEYQLADVLLVGSSEGDFYIEGTSISGTGPGYGVIGKKVVYPAVSFILIAESEAIEESETVFILNEVQGQVSAGEPFIYVLNEGETMAELKPLSVNVNGEKLSDSSVSVIIEGNEVTVTTDYSIVEEGFGEEYLMPEQTVLEVDFSYLGLVFSEGDLKISLIDSGEEIFSMTAFLGEREVITEPVEPEFTEPAPEIIEEPEVLPKISEFELTGAERTVLESEFGNFSVQVSKAVSKNGFITIKSELGEYWVENSYSEDLDEATLQSFMEKDRIKWLRDIANKLSELEPIEEELEEFLS